MDEYYAVSVQNIQILISRLEKNLKKANNVDINKLRKFKTIISKIEYIKPVEVVRIIDKTPNTLLILFFYLY